MQMLSRSIVVLALLTACERKAPEAPTPPLVAPAVKPRSAPRAPIANGSRHAFSVADGTQEATAKAIEARLDAAGIQNVTHVDKKLVLVDLPEGSPEIYSRALDLIVTRGVLGIHLVDTTAPARTTLSVDRGRDKRTLEDAIARTGVEVPADRQFLYQRVEDEWDAFGRLPTHWRVYLVDRSSLVPRDAVADVDVATSESPYPDEEPSRVTVTFDAATARALAKRSSELAGRELAIVLDDKIVTATRDPIHGGQITFAIGARSGSSWVSPAADLAVVLESGPLPSTAVYDWRVKLRDGKMIEEGAE